MHTAFLYSSRLLFIASSPALLKLESANLDAFAAVLNIFIPADWPPGEYDEGAMQFFLDQLEAGGEAVAGWYNWYVISYPTATIKATLVASAGYFGPPDSEGTLEIGYSVAAAWRRRGIASEIVATLVSHAKQQIQVKRIIAHTLPDNEASIRVLLNNGFNQVTSNDPEKLLFQL